MEYHLDRKIVLSEESEFKSLYKWFLRELDGKDKKLGRDQIPWRWSLYFTMSDIAFLSSLGVDRHSPPSDKSSLHQREFIKAKLVPNDARDSRLNSHTSYSMFGTNRIISDFELGIYPTDGEVEEKCTVWGGISYTADIDFRDETSDDTLVFYLHLKAERFARYKQQITEKSLNRCMFRVGFVDGFYSDWSPGISTSLIKILTDDIKHHSIEIPNGCSIVPPRLGEVGEFELTLSSETKFPLLSTDDDNDTEKDDEAGKLPSQPLGQGVAPQFVPVTDATIIKLPKSLHVAAWIIVVLLLMLVFK